MATLDPSIPQLPSLVSDLGAGNRKALAKCISICESSGEAAANVMRHMSGPVAPSHRIGITGPGGAGKSTLTNQLVARYRQGSYRVGVIAVDPMSPYSHGALLGDRVRMVSHSGDQDVFIRSMSSRGRPGGISEALEQVTVLLEAASFDPVIVETVGVGQAEVDVTYSVDTVVLVLTPEFGDDVQSAKAGILEAADIVVINKADLGGADRIRRLLSDVRGREDGWDTPLLTTSALSGAGVEELSRYISAHLTHLVASGELDARRFVRRRREFMRAVRSHLAMALPDVMLESAILSVAEGIHDPWSAALGLVDEVRRKLE